MRPVHTPLALLIARLLLVLALGAPAAAGVLVVNASGPGHHTDLPAAIAAAGDGDVLLVKAGTYSGFTIQNKALDVVAESGATPLVAGYVTVRHLAATRSVTLTGLRVQPTTHPPSGTVPTLTLLGNVGAVRLQGLDIRGYDVPGCIGLWGGDALSVQTSGNVFATRSSIRGGRGGDGTGYSGYGGAALEAWDSSIALYETTLTGGRGGDVSPSCPFFVYGYAGSGGVGAALGGAILFGSGCTIQGGDGGDAPMLPNGWTVPGCGGAGLHAFASTGGPSTARVLESPILAGAPGAYPFSHPCPTTPAMYVAPGSALLTTNGSARRTSATRLVREQQNLRIDFEGEPGDRVELVFAEKSRFLYSDAWRGVLALQTRSPGLVLQAGTLDANGRLTIAWPVPELGAGVEARRFFLQAAFIDLAGSTTLGPPGTAVLLDSAF